MNARIKTDLPKSRCRGNLVESVSFMQPQTNKMLFLTMRTNHTDRKIWTDLGIRDEIMKTTRYTRKFTGNMYNSDHQHPGDSYRPGFDEGSPPYRRAPLGDLPMYILGRQKRERFSSSIYLPFASPSSGYSPSLLLVFIYHCFIVSLPFLACLMCLCMRHCCFLYQT
ncbi:hypothetical protein B0H66DRAFT_366144 [Apodospora peruviana]|uniref:Uncharacterized protein n=1 Tax=Apodospora peruviana TaxID=516989 RepID=A0AAE0HVY2_9PEZI|nr:hypothetical protein B0H66DRAFT_366144 [Apodospora peruviana]